MSDTRPSENELDCAEEVATELVRLAAAEIRAGLGGGFAVDYKDADPDSFRDPVSEVDARVERLIRTRLAEAFPGHDVIGEESAERPGPGHDWVWAVDPIDGTTNFVCGLPLFSATVGVLWRGEPVAGAVWCSVSHALSPGVYSARQGGRLRFDGAPHEPAANQAVRRRLVGLPSLTPDAQLSFDARKTGSAALECALVAAGLLAGARFEPLNLWDVAGGACLALAAGREVWIDTGAGWHALERFASPVGMADLRAWRGRMVLGQPEAAGALLEGER